MPVYSLLTQTTGFELKLAGGHIEATCDHVMCSYIFGDLLPNRETSNLATIVQFKEGLVKTEANSQQHISESFGSCLL